MKIVVTGSLGHISRPLTELLVKMRHEVTVISTNPDRQHDIESQGAKAAIGTLEDVAFIASVFKRADAVYTMVPPNNFLDKNLDLYDYYHRLAVNYFQAINQSGIKRIVHLSSIGAHLGKGTGLIVCHYDMEQVLMKLQDVDITFIRAAGFYTNLYSFLPVIKSTNMIMANYGADDNSVWVSTTDIAERIAEELNSPFSGKKVVYVAGDELTGNQIAGILGREIGKPDLKWIVISNEEMQKGLEAAGIGPKIVAGLVEMNASMHSGKLFQDYYLNRSKPGKIKMTDFAKEFALVFNRN